MFSTHRTLGHPGSRSVHSCIEYRAAAIRQWRQHSKINNSYSSSYSTANFERLQRVSDVLLSSERTRAKAEIPAIYAYRYASSHGQQNLSALGAQLALLHCNSVISPGTSETFRSQLRCRPSQLVRTKGRNVRSIATSTRRHQQVPAAASVSNVSGPPLTALSSAPADSSGDGIRERLRKWQDLHGRAIDASYISIEHARDQDDGETATNNGRLADVAKEIHEISKDEEEDIVARDAFMSSSQEGVDSSLHGFINPGDLIELDFMMSERESVLAVVVQRQKKLCQIFTVNGRWLHMKEQSVQYSVPAWTTQDKLEPLLPYLPSITQVLDQATKEAAQNDDLSVPRELAAPLIGQMQRFLAESQEIYRRHAGVLDNAYAVLAHPTDLRYSSLQYVASKLLCRPIDSLSKPELFTVRKALGHAGFGFTFDRRSHHVTGNLQIRSKEQVEMVDRVRDWIRQWQDDMAVRAAFANDEQALQSHAASLGATSVYSFIEKVKSLIDESRRDRQPTPFGHPGPSKKRFSLLKEASSVKESFSSPFVTAHAELARFIEAWACSDLFFGIPRLAALPPLILQATGRYDDFKLQRATGFHFLQEIGICTPYENRVRYDPNLLLPSSQHSKPALRLMNSVMAMQHEHGLEDSMHDLRHDWGDLPVYCIDDVSAHEIDDGISIEPAGEEGWTVHVHIANPTAFFDKTHPLAKIARHMGGTVYLEDNTYMMLPQWASQGHFSLANNRPCLTVTAKVDHSGQLLDYTIRSGHVRNVIRLSPDDVSTLLDGEKESAHDRWNVIMVGGERPSITTRHNDLAKLPPSAMRDLRILRDLARLRSANRSSKRGIYENDREARLEVWANNHRLGLGWKGMNWDSGRTVAGDPVIRLKTRKLSDDLTSKTPEEPLVREWMLLACEVAGRWCAERRIPIIFRGTERRPDSPHPDVLWKEIMEPAIAKYTDGQIPLHLTRQYTLAIGMAVLSTRPKCHESLGVDYYSKVTSPLRRYSDMLVHWQIEAALREEARLGRSLVIADGGPSDRSFLPFSEEALKKIALGIKPRESLISFAESYSRQFWISMLLFRAIHFGEAALPLEVVSPPDSYLRQTPNIPPWSYPSAHAPYPHAVVPPMLTYKVHGYVRNSIKTFYAQAWFPVEITELGIIGYMERPEALGLEEAVLGDVWECRIHSVDTFHRRTIIVPVKLIQRDE